MNVRLTKQNPRNGRLRDVEVSSNRLLALSASDCSNFSDLFVSQFSFPVFRSSFRPVDVSVWMPSFGLTVLDVVELSAKEEVCGIDAPPKVTGVENEKSFGDRSVDDFPSNSMSSSVGRLTVAVLVEAKEPRPTRIRTSGTIGTGQQFFERPWTVGHRGRLSGETIWEKRANVQKRFVAEGATLSLGPCVV